MCQLIAHNGEALTWTYMFWRGSEESEKDRQIGGDEGWNVNRRQRLGNPDHVIACSGQKGDNNYQPRRHWSKY